MRWVINILSNYLRFIVNMVIVFLMTPFIIDQIGQGLFGLWSLIFAMVAMFGLLDAGFATTAVKYVSEHWAAKQQGELSETLGTLLLVYTFLGLLCFISVWFLAPHLATSYQLPEELSERFIPILRLLGAVVSLSFPLSLYRAILIGTGRMSMVNMTDLVFALCNALGAFLLLKSGWGIVGLAFSTAVTMLGSFLVFIPCARIARPEICIRIAKFNFSRLRELLSFSVYVFLANIAMLVILRIDPLVIAQFLTLESVAIYAIAAKIAEYTYLLNKQFSNALMPLISQSNGTRDPDAVKRIMVDGSRYLLAVATPFIALLMFFSPDLIKLWVGDSFSASSELLRILLICVYVGALQLLPANVLAMGGQHRLMAGVMAISAGLNLILSVLFIQIYGLTGVALGTLLATLIVELFVVIPRACKLIDIRLHTFLISVLWPCALPLFSLIIVTSLGVHSFELSLLHNLVLLGLVSGMAYLLTFFWTGMKVEERRWVYGAIVQALAVDRRRAA